MRDFFRPGRSPVHARDAAIATSHPLATAAGLEILAQGGNAVDAALAAVSTQCVVEAHMTGIGGDCFVLYAPAGGEVQALNGSGRAPKALTAAHVRGQGHEAIPQQSPHSVTVPGAISAWTKLHRDYGSIPLARLFARAIDYAENGYPVSPRVAADWAELVPLLQNDAGCSSVFLPGGAIPKAGETHRQPLLGARLRDIAAEGAKAFYTGKTAQSLVKFLQSKGGLHTLEDFEAALDGANYVKPISAPFRGHEVVECPPNGQGLAALMILRIMERFDLKPMSMADRIHVHAEATKIAYHHRDAFVCDPEYATESPERLLSDEVIDALAARIDLRYAGKPVLWHEPEHKDTIYLACVDAQGNAISFINSIFHGFGSGQLDPETGVLLHSRGASFRLEEGHPNTLAGGKRPLHTIIPGMLRKDGKTVAPFGVMGGHYQAAGHAQFVSGVLDLGLDVQEAIDRPRSFGFNGELELEPTIPEDVRADLAARGHKIVVKDSPIGGGQAVWIDRVRGLLLAGSDQRKDGCALGF